MSDHRTRIQPTTYKMFTPVCSCGWMGGDHGGEQEAAEEAGLHREGRVQSWQFHPDQKLRGWNPDRHPFEGV